MSSLVLTAGTAHAGGSSTSDVACGYSPANTNIPKGAIGLSQGDGPIRSILLAVGEARTHSFIAHGNGYYTHSTMFSPGTNDLPKACDLPVRESELQNGYPGASQINGGALYTFYYQSQSGGPSSGATATGFHNVSMFYYQRSPESGAGADIADWLWLSSNYAWVGSKQDSASGFWRVGFDQTPYTQYSFYQYRDMQNINSGNVPWNYGNVCSTYLAWAQQRAGFGDVYSSTYTYSHSRIVNGINALYNAVESECNDSTGFFEDVGAGIVCLFTDFDTNVCDDAARQVTNCFADGINGRCYSSDSKYYKRVRDQANPPGPRDANGMGVAVAVSPDGIGGWSGHPWGSEQPRPVWSWDVNQQVYWNSGGNVYGCFF